MIDALAFSPHPDDVELYCSGTLARMKREGTSIGIIDITRGELSSRGTLETREKETQRASEILQLDVRENLGIPDGNIEINPTNRNRVIEVLRRLKPTTVFLPYHEDRHPDHEHASRLVREAIFYSGLNKIIIDSDTGELRPYRPKKYFYYMLASSFIPSFVVDVTETFATRLETIKAYSTQFNSPSSSDSPHTFVSSPEFMEFIVARARQLGFSIGAMYGEGFKNIEMIEMPLHGLI